ncbi:MAG: 2-oxo-4-hydroxy-4-carboxy-5-ureidoimidazoline decarboxylase, partial [Anaerolineae bacterium]|nr:2-oxo-4-hydroxy-4-carboxy-5-ureidoimidazoline decarboxylase [Anaerolineae bacterium]
MSLAVLNNAPDAQFLELIGGPLEGQIWLAERVSAYRPFANVEALIAAFEQVVNNASEGEHIALIASHPDLAGKAAIEKPLSAESVREQTAAGLTRLTPEQYAEFQELNSDYKAKFSFPFVICARENTRES